MAAAETTLSDLADGVVDRVQFIAANYERRASYGPNSPVVGERGARTRQAILDAALDAFEAQGFQATSIDDIAIGAGSSRATLYQYFESKEHLFLELIRKAAADLLRLIRRLGPLGPTPEGYDNLHWWLGEWAWVQDKYKSVYMESAIIDSTRGSVRSLIAEQIVSYVSTLSPRLVAALDEGATDIDGLATVLPALLFRMNDYRQKGNLRGLTDDEWLASLATFLQLTLFPSTEARVLATHTLPGPPAPRSAASQRRRPEVSVQRRPAAQPPADGGGAPPETVNRIIEAGAAMFASRGFHGASVGDVLRAARAGRGTFYKYFDDKMDLLVTLARNCMGRLENLADGFAQCIVGDDTGVALRQWIEQCLAMHRQYRGVFRAMLQEEGRSAALRRLRAQSGETILLGFENALSSVDRDHPFDVRIGSLILLALLERGPDYSFGTPYDLSNERVVEILAALIENGLLNRNRR